MLPVESVSDATAVSEVAAADALDTPATGWRFTGDRRSERIVRRAVTVPGLFVFAVVVTVGAVVWVPVAAVVDLVAGRRRLSSVRVGGFAVWWAWVEVISIVVAGSTWLIGRGSHQPTQFALTGWWVRNLLRGFGLMTGVSPVFEGADALAGGNAIVVSRHTSFADPLASVAAVFAAGLSPGYVLKRPLIVDPCLDVVAPRINCHFVDRGNGAAELAELHELAATVSDSHVLGIFPEGWLASDIRRQRFLDRIASDDPPRAERLGALQHLLPPRTAGVAALLDGAPHADVVFVWHIGFDGLSSVAASIRRLGNEAPPCRVVFRRVPRSTVDDAADFTRWLDDEWLRLDAEVDAAFAAVAAQR